MNMMRATLFGAIMRIMNSAIAGLIGAAIGAVAGIAGTIVTQYLQIRAERKQALRSKREAAYTNTLQCLLRVRDRRMSDLKRSDIKRNGGQVVPFYFQYWDLPEWTDAYLVGDIPAFREEAFDDIVGARLWITSATAYCSPKVRSLLLKSMDALEDFATNILEQEFYEPPEEDPPEEDLYRWEREELGEGFILWATKYDNALTTSYRIVLSCAQDDLRDAYR